MGPIQKEWIKSLREHPERQTRYCLGNEKGDGTYEACCLGELVVVYCKMTGLSKPFNEGGVLFSRNSDGVFNRGILMDYEEYGLARGDGATIMESPEIKGKVYSSLAAMNDGGMTWPEIADYVEQNEKNVFIKDV